MLRPGSQTGTFAKWEIIYPGATVISDTCDCVSD